MIYSVYLCTLPSCLNYFSCCLIYFDEILSVLFIASSRFLLNSYTSCTSYVTYFLGIFHHIHHAYSRNANNEIISVESVEELYKRFLILPHKVMCSPLVEIRECKSDTKWISSDRMHPTKAYIADEYYNETVRENGLQTRDFGSGQVSDWKWSVCL